MQFGAIKNKNLVNFSENIRCYSLPIIDDMFHANVGASQPPDVCERQVLFLSF